ncbi:MAG TPA: creatininase family protein [Planctomycetota bacterium]|nr:creatininase family protein [Planctomycetota bacterium]
MGYIQHLAELTFPEAEKALKGSTALWPIGAIEAHGPHLPLATDAIISEEIARRAAERLSTGKVTVVILPTLAVTPAKFASAFAGTLSLSEGTAAAVVCDVAKSLDRHGVAKLVLVNCHFDPANLKALHAAAEALASGVKLKVIFPDVTQKPWASRLPMEFKRGGAHAGSFETSMVMAARPKAVRESERIGLVKVEVDLGARIREGARTFEDVGASFAYMGDPAVATADEGNVCLDLMRDIVVEATTAT